MSTVSVDLLAHVFARLREVQRQLGFEPVAADDPEQRLSDLLDSMGVVELLAVLAQDRGVRADAIERAAGQRFSSVASLAAALERAGTGARNASEEVVPDRLGFTLPECACWLSAPCVRFPRQVEESRDLDARLDRPAGWLEAHAGIRRRHVWADEDALAAAAAVGRAALESAELLVDEVGAVLVTSQAPPLLAGLAATVHQRLGLPPRAVALEIGGACTGFLQALWLARQLIERLETVLLLAVESPSRHLLIDPGDAGEAAALFGDATAACIVTREPVGTGALPLKDVELQVEADADGLLRVEADGLSGLHVRMNGPRLATHAVECLAELVREVVRRHQLSVNDLSAVIVHGGNGRLPALVARRLELPSEKVWSETAETGNLGSASLPVAWAAHGRAIAGPVAWAAIGAGLNLASALTLTSSPVQS